MPNMKPHSERMLLFKNSHNGSSKLKNKISHNSFQVRLRATDCFCGELLKKHPVASTGDCTNRYQRRLLKGSPYNDDDDLSDPDDEED